MANNDTTEAAEKCAKDAGAIVKCPSCNEYRATGDEYAGQRAVALALRRQDEGECGFQAMEDEQVREAIESAIKDAGYCRCHRYR